MSSRLPRTKTLTGPIPGCVIRESSAAAPACVDVSEAEMCTLRRFRRTLPLHGLDRSQRWPTDLSRFPDRWLTVGEVTDAALIADGWRRVRQAAMRMDLDLHALADALMALRATNDNCRRGSKEWVPRPGASWMEHGRSGVIVARNWAWEAGVGVSGTGEVVRLGLLMR